MYQYLHYSLSPDVELEFEDGVPVALVTPMGRTSLTENTLWRILLGRLARGSATISELSEAVKDGGEFTSISTLYFMVDQLLATGTARIRIGEKDGPLAELIPGSVLLRLPTAEIPMERAFQLSRFAFLRRDGENLLLESPRALCTLRLLTEPATVLVQSLAKPTPLAEVLQDEAEPLRLLGQFLVGLDFLAEIGADGQSGEDTAPTLRYWEFHDLLFHSRSRMGRHAYPCGATFPFRGQFEPEPALKPPPAGKAPIYLEKADLEWLKENDFPFTAVLEYRRSVRAYGQKPISLSQLGEFLYRSLRVRGIHPIDEAREHFYETSSRPYPSGGGSYEMEIYLTVNACEGLSRGIYWYDPDGHALYLVQDNAHMVEALLNDAWASAAKTIHPQVLVTFAPRFARLTWKYRGMGYSASLKNAGVLYQTMYLVATAMNLAPCALGNGNSMLFSQAVGNDYFAESSTAEFMLGSMPQEP